MAGSWMRGSQCGYRQDLNGSLKSNKEMISLLLLSKSEAWPSSCHSGKILCNMKRMKIPILKDIIADGIPCLTHPYKLEWRAGPCRKWIGLTSPSQEKQKQSSAQSSSPSRSICSWCSVRLRTQQANLVIDGVPLDMNGTSNDLSFTIKQLLFHLLPFPGMQLWLFALCINL